MDHAEVVELVRSAQRAGVEVAVILAFLDVIKLQDRFAARASAVAPKRPDYAD
jgi:hypothetical protein